MQAIKRLGIWMDHSSAHVMEYSNASIETKIIESTFTHQEKEHSLTKGEASMHNKEQQQQGAYYKELGEIIRNYDEVLLFGPTDAKTELFNLLAEDQHFSKIKMDVQQTDKMTENQEHAFIKDYFSGVHKV
jgi:nitrogenase subunit NifH